MYPRDPVDARVVLIQQGRHFIISVSTYFGIGDARTRLVHLQHQLLRNTKGGASLVKDVRLAIVSY